VQLPSIISAFGVSCVPCTRVLGLESTDHAGPHCICALCVSAARQLTTTAVPPTHDFVCRSYRQCIVVNLAHSFILSRISVRVSSSRRVVTSSGASLALLFCRASVSNQHTACTRSYCLISTPSGLVAMQHLRQHALSTGTRGSSTFRSFGTFTRPSPFGAYSGQERVG